jgi:integrase
LRVLPEFGSSQLAAITRGDLHGFVDQMLAGELAASTIRNTINLELPVARGRRDRIATAVEASRLIKALPPEDQGLWATAFYAGLRRGELQALRGSDIDLKRSEIDVQRSWDQEEGPISPKSKAGTRTVPLLAVLRPYLEDAPSGHALVFGWGSELPFDPKAIGDRAKRSWDDANTRESDDDGGLRPALHPMTLHECRHTFASLLIDAGVNPKAIQEFMGHATIEETFSRYGHLMPGARDQARELVDAYMEREAA